MASRWNGGRIDGEQERYGSPVYRVGLAVAMMDPNQQKSESSNHIINPRPARRYNNFYHYRSVYCLSDQIKQIYSQYRQTATTSDVKEAFRCKLQLLLTQSSDIVKPIRVQYIGSSETSELALDDSDLDLCVQIGMPLKDWHIIPMLEYMRPLIDQLDGVTSRPTVIGRLNPIVQFYIGRRWKDDLKVDIQLYNLGSARSTHLVANYVRADARFQKLALILKLWAKKYSIDGTNRGLSSYALNLMLIHYLQVGCSPPVLPCLHQMYPSVFNANSDPIMMKQFQRTFISVNKQNLGDLLIGFFHYWSEYYSDRMLVTVTDGRRVSRNRQSFDPELIYIEEPFTGDNVVKLADNETNFMNIKTALGAAYYDLKSSYNLEDIL